MDETIAQFASPAKRRKMGKLVVSGAGGLCSPDPKGAGSRLKGNNTPGKHFKSRHDMPATPGSKLSAAGLDDGLLSASPEQLPADLMLLHHLLGALYVTMPLVKSRSKSTTYQNLRVPVQNFTGRDFQIKHIQQIKALCPEALGWEYILAINAANGKHEQQLLLKMPASVVNSKQTADTAQLQQLFFTRLQKHMQTASSSCELPRAELPPLAGPNARDCTPNRRPINPDMLPGTPQTAPPAGYVSRVQGSSTPGNQMPLMSPPPKRAATSMKPKSLEGLMSPPPARTRAAQARQVEGHFSQPDFTFSPAPRQPDSLLSPRGGVPGPFSSLAQASTRHHTPVRSRTEEASPANNSTPAAGLRPNKLFGTPVATSTPQQTTTRQRPTDKHATPVAAVEDAAGVPASGVKVRKLTFGSAKKAPAAAASTAAEVNRAAKPSVIKFELGGKALELLEKVTNAEAQQEKAVRQKELDQQRALDMLPGTFDVLRAVYGDKGPCVKTKSDVLVLLRQKSTCKSGMSLADASEQLELLLRFIPEFVRTINSPGQSLAGMTQSVRINRQVSWPAARQKLLAAAAKARSSGITSAAEALAAEEQREKQEEAAAAAAAVEVEQSESEADYEADYEAEATVVAGGEHSSMDQTDLDILAQLDGGSNSSRQPAGVEDEIELLLGTGPAAGSGKQNRKGVSTDALLSCLAFKAPAKRRT